MLGCWKNADGNRVEHQAGQKKPDTKNLYYIISFLRNSRKDKSRDLGKGVGCTLGKNTKVPFLGDIKSLYPN